MSNQLAERTTAQEVFTAMILDVWPGRAAIVDFGLKTPEHYAALHHAVRVDGVTAEQLDEALGSGARIQALISKTNPYRRVVFSTDWDEMPDESEDEEAE